MDQLPRDVIRILFVLLPTRSKLRFSQTNQRIRSCTNAQERLIWSCGPPEPGKIIQQLEQVATSIRPGFKFDFKNFCTTCNCPVDEHPFIDGRQECPYSLWFNCEGCGSRGSAWPHAPWETRVNSSVIFSCFGFHCKVCQVALSRAEDHFTSPHYRRFCEKCKEYLCHNCFKIECLKCFEFVNLQGTQEIDRVHQCNGNLLYRWMLFIREKLGEGYVVHITNKQFVGAWRDGDLLQLWCPNGDEGVVAKVMGHTKSQRRHAIPGDSPFLHIFAGEPDLSIPLKDQKCKVLTVDEYVENLD